MSYQMEPSDHSHRVLRIIRSTRGGKTVFRIDPFDVVLLKDGTSYRTGAPTSFDFVNAMGVLEYDQIEYTDDAGSPQNEGAGQNLLTSSRAFDVRSGA